MSLWQLGPIMTSSYFKRGAETSNSTGNPPDGALSLVVVVMGWREWLKIWM